MSEKHQEHDPASGIPATRTGRVIWLTVAVIFLSLAAMVIWTWAHSRVTSSPGLPRETAGDSESAAEAVSDEASSDEAATAESGGLASAPSPLLPTSEGAVESETRGRAEEPIYHGRRDGCMEIALSFDDGPHPRYTPLILEILAEYDIHATFFMVGENVGYYPAAAEAVAAAGHEIGNHTFSHRQFSRMNEHEMRSEIAACERAVGAITEDRMRFMRPPEGCLNDTMQRVIGGLDYRIVLWDIDTRDWAHTPPDTICRHILDTVQSGDIILMHDFIGHDSPTPEALRLVIPALLERGYRFVTVGKLLDGGD